MNCYRPIILLAALCLLSALGACSSTPSSKEECIEKYKKGVTNNNASQAIEKACISIFDATKTDDGYHKCILDEMPSARTDKDVNIIIRKCTMQENR